MSFVYDDLQPIPKTGGIAPGGEDTGYVENFNATIESLKRTNQSNSRAINLQGEWQPIVEDIQEKTGKKFFNPANVLAGYQASSESSTKQYDYYSKQVLDYVKNRPDLFPDYQMTSNESLFESAKKKAIEAKDISEDVAAKQNFAGFLGEMSAGAVSVLTDPVQLGAIGVDLLYTRGATWTAMKEIFFQSVVSAGSEAIVQTEVKDWYKELELPYDWTTFATNVGTAAVGAGVITAGVLGAKPAVRFTKDQIVKGIEVLGKYRAQRDGVPYTVDPNVAMLKEAVSDEASIFAANPIKGDAGDLEHTVRVNDAYRAVVEADVSRLPNNLPENERVPITDINYHDRINSQVYSYKPNELLVDAELFQFKAGGDVMGVTERLQGVTSWDPIKANTAIVFEFADGKTFIADGHQRLALAKRLQEADPTQDIQINAFKLREVDGFTPAEARAVAAGKNLAEGSGTLLDAAKILRDAPDLIKTLPPRSVFVRQAQDLSNLSNPAFMAVVNDIVPPNMASLVGRYIADEAEQLSILNLLKRLEPANMTQAEQIVIQAREAGFARAAEQGGLFGDQLMAESLFLERAKILDRAIKEIRKDKTLFETLVKNATEIEEAGNTLAKLTNQQKEEIYGKAIAIIQANANTKGPISESLTRAAQAWKETGGAKAQDIVRDFTESVRRSIESGDYEGIPNGGDRGDFAAEAQSNRFAEPGAEELNLFDTGPGSKGAERQAEQLETDLRGEMPNSGRPITVDEYVAKSLNEEDVAKLDPDGQLVLRNLYQDAALRKEAFDRTNREIADFVGGEYRQADLKGSPRAVEKILLDYDGDASQIKDLLRATIVVDNFQQAGVALRELRSKYTVLDKGFRNLLDPNVKALDGGYRDIKMNVEIDGHVAEVQINIPEFIAAKKRAHSLYEEVRTIEGTVVAERRQPTAAEAARIDELNVQMAASYDSAFEAALSRSNSALSIGAPLRRAESGGKGLGEPLSQAAQYRVSKPSTSPSVTGMPSTSRNSTFLDDFISDTSDLSLARIDTGSKANQELMDLEVPIGEKIDPVTGERVPELSTVRDILNDFDQDQTMLDRLIGCVK
jgi:hypothetical protein